MLSPLSPLLLLSASSHPLTLHSSFPLHFHLPLRLSGLRHISSSDITVHQLSSTPEVFKSGETETTQINLILIGAKHYDVVFAQYPKTKDERECKADLILKPNERSTVQQALPSRRNSLVMRKSKGRCWNQKVLLSISKSSMTQQP